MADDTDVPDEVLEDNLLAVPLSRQDTPFNEPDDLLANEQAALDDTHPITDTDIEIEEEYDEGLSGAAEAQEPNRRSAVIGYHPDTDRLG